MAQAGHILGVDFGTSNSAASYLRDGSPCLIELSAGRTTMPTTFFFDFDTRKTLMGEPASAALLDGAEGRFMRALKRVLGTSLMHEKRQIMKERVTFVDIIARFLREIKGRAEAETGLIFDRVLSGRPVVFHGSDHPSEANAEADLRACYLAAGFKEVDFLFEPEAAAIASGALQKAGEVGLIVDVGGGTSDFSLFRSGDAGLSILASHGVRIGGTDFDSAISIDSVMPLLGKGTHLRRVMGEGSMLAPNAMFNELARWEMIPFLYTAQNRRAAKEMLSLACEPDRLGRLVTVLEDELGHDLAFAVERGKIAANAGEADACIALGQIDERLSCALSAEALARILASHSESLRAGAQETLRRAGLDTAQVQRVIYVGGSSLMSAVSDAMKAEFTGAQHSFSNVFTAVADGLALAAGQTGSAGR